MSEPEKTKTAIDNCIERIHLIESTFHYCSDKEAARQMGVYESAAKQIVEHLRQIHDQLARLRSGV